MDPVTAIVVICVLVIVVSFIIWPKEIKRLFFGGGGRSTGPGSWPPPPPPRRRGARRPHDIPGYRTLTELAKDMEAEELRRNTEHHDHTIKTISKTKKRRKPESTGPHQLKDIRYKNDLVAKAGKSSKRPIVPPPPPPIRRITEDIRLPRRKKTPVRVENTIHRVYDDSNSGLVEGLLAAGAVELIDDLIDTFTDSNSPTEEFTGGGGEYEGAGATGGWESNDNDSYDGGSSDCCDCGGD